QVTVRVTRETGMMGPPRRTDANGEFRIDDLPAGSHTLDIRHEEFIPAEMPVSVSVGQDTRADVELSRGRDLQGRVIDEAGIPVAYAEITSMGNMGAGALPPPGPRVATDANGVFELSALR